MTPAEFDALLAACDFNSPKQVSELVTATHTNTVFNDKIEERMVNNPLSAYNYFQGLFGTEVWPDGQGMDMIREYYADPHIPFTFSHFIRKTNICDPNLANECNRDRCKVPEGGRGTLPSQVFFQWGFETQRDCIANIRQIRQFMFWASRVIRARELIDTQVMNMFYTMAGIKTAGSKVTMQGVRDANNQLKLVGSTNPRNPLQFGLFNYLEEKFPQPTNINDLAPLTQEALDSLARYWTMFPKNNHVATGPRGELIWEFWYPDDWYATEALRDPDYMQKIKLLQPRNLFPGYTNAPGDREVIGNFAARVMPFLPRYAPTADGQIVPVDTQVGVDIEVGKEYLGSIEFINAPIGLAGIVSGKQGTILTRPTLTQSGAGFPIHPIASSNPWWIRNEYDAVCNKDLNQPYSQKDYEMGFRMDNPDASIMFLFRRRIFNMRPVNECDLAPMFNVESSAIDCAVTTIGCDAKRREDDNIVKQGDMQYVNCTYVSCGNTEVAPFLYNIKVDRRSNMPGYNSLGCDCGSEVNLFIYDENNVFSRQILGVLKDMSMNFPYARYFVETQTALADGECIRGISCTDSTALQGNVIDAWDAEDGDLEVLLDSPIVCGLTDDVTVTYYDANGVVLGTEAGIIEEFDPARYYYKISGGAGLKADAFDNQASMGVSCAEGANASSSSSSSSSSTSSSSSSSSSSS